MSAAAGRTGGRTDVEGRTGGRADVEGRTGGRADVAGRAGGRADVEGRTGGRADVAGRTGGRADVGGRTGGRADVGGRAGGRVDVAERVDLAGLVAAAREMVADGRRRVLGITGAPGAGKSTLARQITEALEGRAVLVGLDSFHLSNAELHRLGRHDRKGAADTFDAAGYQALLRRLRPQVDEIVYAAEFDRSIEESITCVVPVHRDTPLIVTEGNYLLVDDERWGATIDLIDEVWYVEPGEDVRMERLIARHMRFGRSPREAHERSYGSDQRNAELIASTRPRAHRVVRLISEKEPA